MFFFCNLCDVFCIPKKHFTSRKNILVSRKKLFGIPKKAFWYPEKKNILVSRKKSILISGKKAPRSRNVVSPKKKKHKESGTLEICFTPSWKRFLSFHSLLDPHFSSIARNSDAPKHRVIDCFRIYHQDTINALYGLINITKIYKKSKRLCHLKSREGKLWFSVRQCRHLRTQTRSCLRFDSPER